MVKLYDLDSPVEPTAVRKGPISGKASCFSDIVSWINLQVYNVYGRQRECVKAVSLV